MQRDFWLDRWNTGRIAFHEPSGNQRLAGQWTAIGAPAGGRVLVPLCGKSVDMLWLAARQNEVIGVELSATAASAFFTENKLPFEVEDGGPFVAYRSTDPRHAITILNGDFFALDVGQSRDLSAIYDRAATIALPDEMRQRYVAHLGRLASPGVTMLLIAIEYDEACMQGPPFSLSDAAVRALYEPGFAVDLVDQVSGPEVAGRLRERGLETLTERAYRLRRIG